MKKNKICNIFTYFSKYLKIYFFTKNLYFIKKNILKIITIIIIFISSKFELLN